MYKITEKRYSQQLPNQDTSVSIRRSKIETVEGQETQSEHHRLSVDCLTFANNQNHLHEQLIKLSDGSVLDLTIETDLKADLDALKAELIAKDWQIGTQLITDYETWKNNQSTL